MPFGASGYYYELVTRALPMNLTLGESRWQSLEHIRILYAEDYDLVLFTVKQLLELEGWGVDICRDGSAALNEIESDKRYDLLILDAQLPGRSGLTLIDRVRQLTHRRHLPIIMFTGSMPSEEALACGANAFLNKPTGLKELISTCHQLLNTDAKNDETPAIYENRLAMATVK